MQLSTLEYLRRILYETEYIITEKEDFNEEQFSRDATIKHAFMRSIEIIGEASKKVPSKIKNRYPDVEWRAMAGIRKRLMHDYFGVDDDIIWDVVQNKIPILHDQIVKILDQEN